MEGGSLLMDALRHMKRHQEMQELCQDGSYSFWSDQNQSANIDDCSNTSMNYGGAYNRLCLSIYLIDPEIYNTNVPHDTFIKLLLQNLSMIHGIIHKELIPCYNQKYQHCWYNGGEGIVFGMHCQDIHRSEASDKRNSIPHLRSVIHYGPNIMDEYFALAIIYTLSSDLYQLHGMKVAIECWDMDDGHILLIEGADALPSWVDDEIGVQGMNRRAYVTNGRISIIPQTNYKENHTPGISETILSQQITRREALNYLGKECTSIFNKDDTSSCCTYPALDRLIQCKLHDFLTLLKMGDPPNPRKALKEYLHTAAIVLPLRLALMVERSNLVLATLISSFCRHCANAERKQEGLSTLGTDVQIPFENLVVTTITIPKTLFAILLTGAGKCPPPYKIPLPYKTIEMKRMKRKFETGGTGFDHFRHAIEAGVRLALGYEWFFMTGRNGKSKESCSPIIKAFSPEDRMTTFYQSLIHQTGGNSAWVQSSWNLGPNFTAKEDSIENLINCPVWDPEIVRGGPYPLSKPAKTLHQLMIDHHGRCKKFEMDSINDVQEKFPIPRPNEVDADDWLDFHSIDELDAKMNDIISPKPLKTQSNQFDTDKISDGEKMSQMDSIINGLHDFIQGTSDIEGVSSTAAHDVSQDRSTIDIDRSVYLNILRNSLKLDLNEKLELGDSYLDHTHDPGLKAFFSKEDLDFNFDSDDDENDIYNKNDDEYSNVGFESGISIKDLMTTMDRELEEITSDRSYSDEEMNLNSLSFNDPGVLKANAISNMIQSLDSQVGAQGPVSTIFKGLQETKS